MLLAAAMRGDLVYRVYGIHAGRAADVYFGTFRTRAAAEAKVAELAVRTMHGESWARRYHDRGFAIREVVVEVDFDPPPPPKPRDRYLVRGSPVDHGPGVWPSTQVEVLRRADAAGVAPTRVAGYLRNYAMYATFEPFRQGGHDHALVSRDYTSTAVLDLASGEVIAEEPADTHGFCPVGFYVPDWWDLHDGSIIPGSPHWRADDHEWPVGDLGFVWGCVWGDDSSWKVQCLDLSRIREGIVRRDERFGHVELATHGWTSPCFDERPALPSKPPPFLDIARHEGRTRVRLVVEMDFDLASGAARGWQRTAHPWDE